ncbi:MAG: response regulator [Alphaproteobacteria bacterium]|nr:response regulator [Alphaproteobacteria bacterium]
MPAEGFHHPREILLVEDNPADARLVELAFGRRGAFERLSRVGDGVEAMDFLHRRGAYVDRRRPDLVILDLNLPRKSGREVLAEMKADRGLWQIPVIALSSLDDREVVSECYELGANAYVVKPHDFDGFVAAVQVIERFWVEVVTLPAH